MEVEIEKEKECTVVDKISNDYKAKESPVKRKLPKKVVTAREKDKIEKHACENRHKMLNWVPVKNDEK